MDSPSVPPGTALEPSRPRGASYDGRRRRRFRSRRRLQAILLAALVLVLLGAGVTLIVRALDDDEPNVAKLSS